VILELEEEPVRPEDLAIPTGDVPRQVPVLDLERLGDLAAETGRKADQPLAVARR
jgi:hypothetical protein